MLIGSENLYGGTADYEELSCEFVVPEPDTKTVVNLAFTFEKREYLRAPYYPRDIRIYGNKCGSASGRPYLPCHRETAYWNRIGGNGDDDDTRDVGPHYIYCILEYNVGGAVVYLAFDRHYQFCGELAIDTFQYLSTRYVVRRQKDTFLTKGQLLPSSAPLKDYFAVFHPIARNNAPVCAHYVEDPR